MTRLSIKILGYIFTGVIAIRTVSHSFNWVIYDSTVRSHSDWLKQTQHESNQYSIARGWFRSEVFKYGLVSGRITTVLPHPIPRDIDFKCRVTVHYNLISMFLVLTRVNKFEVIGHVPSGSNLSYGGDANDDECDSGQCNERILFSSKYSKGLKMKGSINGSPIEYQSIIGNNDSIVVGAYTWLMDYGHFRLSLTETAIASNDIQNNLHKTWSQFLFC
eukprot:255003_1